ncbi:hypothetical protein B0O80DRAFT_139759 [Mortierella sp. GBAus27b]|nr:hypothetical protein B0O80DRAFT_139759 [Mortierella sp. GBAus27b]
MYSFLPRGKNHIGQRGREAHLASSAAMETESLTMVAMEESGWWKEWAMAAVVASVGAAPMSVFSKDSWSRASQHSSSPHSCFSSPCFPPPLITPSFHLLSNDSYSFATAPERFDGCVPGVTVREYHPFYLESVKLESLVSKKPEESLVVGGIRGNKEFQQLEVCAVSSDYGCDRNIPSNCIYPDVEYRFRVNSPVRGHLKINDNKELEIVENYSDAPGLNLYRKEGWELRVAHRQEDGSRAVISTNGGGRAITLVEQVKNDARQ